MADVLWGAAHQGLAGHPADFHGVVGDEAVAALNELDGGFAFTHAAVAYQQDALAVDLDEHAVAGDAGGQLHVEQGDQVRHHVGGGIPGGEQGNVIALRSGGHVATGIDVPGHNDGGGAQGEKVVDGLCLFLFTQAFQHGHFRAAQHSDALGVEIVAEAVQLQAGADDVPGDD